MKPFLGVDTYFFLCGTSYQYIHHGNLIFFYFDNLEPAPGRPAPEMEVKTLKTVNMICGSNQKGRSLPLKMASQIPKNA